MRVGFIGAGRMGRPMVDRLVAAGHEVRVLGRTEDQRAELETAGAHPVATSAAAGRGAAVVFAANIGLLAQAAKLAAEFGVEESVLLSALPHGSSASFALSAVARRESVTAFAEAVREFLAKDVALVRHVAADQGATLGVLDAAIGELSL